MKTPRFLFTALNCGALTLGLASAGEPPEKDSHQARPTRTVPAHTEQADRRPPLLNNDRPAVPIKHETKRAPANELHPPGLKKEDAAGSGGVRVRAAATAGVGGAAPAHAKHSAAMVNGADIQHKP